MYNMACVCTGRLSIRSSYLILICVLFGHDRIVPTSIYSFTFLSLLPFGSGMSSLRWESYLGNSATKKEQVWLFFVPNLPASSFGEFSSLTKGRLYDSWAPRPHYRQIFSKKKKKNYFPEFFFWKWIKNGFFAQKHPVVALIFTLLTVVGGLEFWNSVALRLANLFNVHE